MRTIVHRTKNKHTRKIIDIEISFNKTCITLFIPSLLRVDNLNEKFRKIYKSSLHAKNMEILHGEIGVMKTNRIFDIQWQRNVIWFSICEVCLHKVMALCVCSLTCVRCVWHFIAIQKSIPMNFTSANRRVNGTRESTNCAAHYQFVCECVCVNNSARSQFWQSTCGTVDISISISLVYI